MNQVKQILLTAGMAFVISAAFLMAPYNAFCETGVTGDEIVLGMSNALTGPASALGNGMKTGAMAYFDKINASGGINGRKIRLISYDDGYEPRETVENTQKLVGQDKVFALFGYVGTPTSKAIIPIINKNKIIYFGAFTGAEFLRNPVNRYIFNVRSSYFDEAEAQVDYLHSKLGIANIGLFIQNDAYGLAVKGGVMRALKKRKLPLTGEGKYTRNTVDVDEGLNALKSSNPQAVSMVGTYKAMATFIKKAQSSGFKPKFLNVSFVGTDSLLKELGNAGDGTIITQVVPSPYDPSLHIVKQYQNDMKTAGHADFGYVSLEGYMNAVVFVEILKASGANITRESFITAAESLSFKDSGMTFRFSPDNHQALDKVYLTELKNGQVVDIK